MKKHYMKKQVDKLYLCNVKKPTDHCKNHCFCGMGPHRPNKCTNEEYCDIVNEDVKCIPLSEEQLNKFGMTYGGKND